MTLEEGWSQKSGVRGDSREPGLDLCRVAGDVNKEFIFKFSLRAGVRLLLLPSFKIRKKKKKSHLTGPEINTDLFYIALCSAGSKFSIPKFLPIIEV